jgi:membrane-associated phospholipid phosphatase
MRTSWFIIPYFTVVILSYFFWDKPIAELMHDQDLRAHTVLLIVCVTAGKWNKIVAVLLFFVIFFRYIKKNYPMQQRMYYLLLCVLLNTVVGGILKVILGKARPDLLFSEHLFGFYWLKFNDLHWSVPSGHVMAITGLASGLSILFPRYFYGFMFLALIIISSRVFFYFHYFSDVLVTFYLGVVVVGFLTQQLRKKHCFVGIL